MAVLKLRPRADFFFTVTAWELATLRHLHRVVEDNIKELLQRYGTDDGSGHPMADLDLLHVEARLPPLFRVPILTMAWSLYEACLVETGRFFAGNLNLPYSVDSHYKEVPLALRNRWRRWCVIRRAKYFFLAELNLALTETPSDEPALHRLRELRNNLAHTGGRSSKSRSAERARLEEIARLSDGLDIETGYVVATSEYVRDQIDLVDRCSTHLVMQARRLVIERGLDKRR